jgi:methylmalonyl-CoA/ethylmalonyl-CoA epimerase
MRTVMPSAKQTIGDFTTVHGQQQDRRRRDYPDAHGDPAGAADMIVGIDHIGLVTDDPAGVAPFMSALGLAPAGSGVAESYNVSCDFWRHANGGPAAAVELVAPLGPDSAVHDHLARRGPGLYHIAFEVDAIEPELARLTGLGFVALDAQPCAGALPGMRVAFLYLRRPAALLVELVEYAAGRGDPASES